MKCCKCCKQPVPEKPRDEVVTIEGISYTIHHWEMGRTVDSPCSCFGGFRCHSTHQCPWMQQRDALEAMSADERALYLVGREVAEGALREFEGQLTAAQTNALFRQVVRVSQESPRGALTASVHRIRSSLHVSIFTAGPGLDWFGTIGPSGGVRRANPS